MVDFFKVVDLYYSDLPTDVKSMKTKKLLEIVQRQYFKLANPFRIFTIRDDEKKIIDDILEIERNLFMMKNLFKVRFKSQYWENTLENYLLKDKLTDEEIDYIITRYIDPWREHITAVFLGHIIFNQNRIEIWKWIITTIVSILSATTIISSLTYLIVRSLM